MRQFWLWFGGWALILAAACTDGVQGPSDGSNSPVSLDAPPNIVLVLFEDLGPRIGAFGDPLAHTPNFDRIASEGVMYTSVFTTSGVCAPSRAALITGRYQQSISAQHMRTTNVAGIPPGGPQNYLAVPPTGIVAFPEILRARGYHTSNDSKTDYQFGEPFTIWDESGDGADWSNRADGQPFFHMRTFLTTHESAIWPTDMEPQTPIEAFVVSRNAVTFKDRVARTDPADVLVPPYLPDTIEVRKDIATHYDNIAFTDVALGELYDRLEAEGLLSNTILIVSTDHGDGLPRMKRSLYDSGLHVPLVIRFPDQQNAGTVRDELVSFVDLAPSILTLAGAPSPDWIHGQSFLGADNVPDRLYIFAAQDRMDNEPNLRRAIRDQRFKLIVNELDGDPYFEPLAFRDSQPSMQALWDGLTEDTLPEAARRLFEPLPQVQLYDTELDPHEVTNIAEDPSHEETLWRLTFELDAWRERIGDVSPLPESDLIEQIWPGGEQPMTASPMATFSSSEGRRLVSLSSTTPGASIGFRRPGDENGWQLYTEPFEHVSALEVKAIRYGYAESQITTINAPVMQPSETE